MSIFLVATPFRHGDLDIFRIFSVNEDLLRCCVAVVAKLKKHGRVPSFVLNPETVPATDSMRDCSVTGWGRTRLGPDTTRGTPGLYKLNPQE